MASEHEWRAFPEVPAELRPLFDVWFNPDLVDLPSAAEINMTELIDNILDLYVAQIYKNILPHKVRIVNHPAGGEVTLVDDTHVLEFMRVVQHARDIIYPKFLLSAKEFPNGDHFDFSWIRDMGNNSANAIKGRTSLGGALEDRVSQGLACIVAAFKTGVFPVDDRKAAYERHVDENNGLFVPKGNKTSEAITAASLLDQGLYKIAREIVGKTF